jgi:hypothetical protein
LPHAIHSGLSENSLEAVLIRFKYTNDSTNFRAILRIAGRSETDLFENFLDLALRKRIAVGEFVSKRFSSRTAARQ